MKIDFNEMIEKFRYDPNSVKKNYDGRTDIYLAKVSYRFAYIKRVLSLLLVLVAIAFVLSGNISYEKIYYLTKDIKLSSDFVNSIHDTITYNVGNSQSFAAYRSGIAVASRERLSIFSAGGRELYSANLSYGNPTLSASDRYVLLYDVGGKQLSLYNSFSKLSEKILDYPIYGADISDNGNFAVITKSEDYDSVVKVYQQNGKSYDYNFSRGRISSVSLSENGLKLAVLMLHSDSDELYTEIRVYTLGKSNYESARLSFSGVPYEVRFLQNGSLIAVGERGVNTFNSNLTLTGEYLTDSEIYSYAFGKDNIAIVTPSNTTKKTEIALLNKRGRVEKRLELDERVIDVEMSGDYLFIQKLDGFERYNTSFGISEHVEIMGNDFYMIVSDKNTLIVCNSSYAKFIEFGR